MTHFGLMADLCERFGVLQTFPGFAALPAVAGDVRPASLPHPHVTVHLSVARRESNAQLPCAVNECDDMTYACLTSQESRYSERLGVNSDKSSQHRQTDRQRTHT